MVCFALLSFVTIEKTRRRKKTRIEKRRGQKSDISEKQCQCLFIDSKMIGSEKKEVFSYKMVKFFSHFGFENADNCNSFALENDISNVCTQTKLTKKIEF